MTTNAGASDLAKAAMGFNRSKREGDDEEAIKRMFTPGVPQPARRHHPVRRPAAGGHPQGGGEVRVPARGAARRPRRHHRAVGEAAASGWPRRATTRSSAPGRWRASSRSTSRSRSPTSCCSASWSTAAPCACWSTAKDGEKLGFEYIKADAPIRPRGPDELEDEDLDPDDGGPEGTGGGVKSAPKPKAKRAPRRPGPRRPGARRGLSSSPVPKVPLGSR